MNIAEIRKKARIAKSESEISEGSFSVPSVHHDGGEAGHTQADSGLEMSGEPKPPLSGSLSVGVSEFRESLASSEDRLDQLFSWMPQADDLLHEGSTIHLAGEKRVESISRRWLAFSLGSEDYALDISMIREILKPREITEIPRVPDFLLGIISLRGNIIPIFDLKRRLGLGVGTIDSDSRIIVCQDGDRLAGLLIDRITQVTSIQEEGIEPPPAIFSGRDRALLDGVGRVQGSVLILLNIANVLTVDSNGL